MDGDAGTDHDTLTKVVVLLDRLSQDFKDNNARQDQQMRELKDEVRQAIAASRPQCPSAKCLAHDGLFEKQQAAVECAIKERDRKILEAKAEAAGENAALRTELEAVKKELGDLKTAKAEGDAQRRMVKLFWEAIGGSAFLLSLYLALKGG